MSALGRWYAVSRSRHQAGEREEGNMKTKWGLIIMDNSLNLSHSEYLELYAKTKPIYFKRVKDCFDYLGFKLIRECGGYGGTHGKYGYVLTKYPDYD